MWLRAEPPFVCTHLLDAEGDQQWQLDPGRVAAVHDGLQDGVCKLSGKHEIAVCAVSPAYPTGPETELER